MTVKEESEKSGLKFSIHKTKIMASGPITSWQIDGGNNGNRERLYFLGLKKLLHMVTAATKLRRLLSRFAIAFIPRSKCFLIS